MKAVQISNRVITLKSGKKCWVVVKNAKQNKKFVWVEVEKVFNADFIEAEHPRDKSGQFTKKGSGVEPDGKSEKREEKSSKKGSMKGVMKKLSEYKGKEGGTYSYETGEPVEKSDGFFVSFHQNEADEKGNFKSHFGKYTEDEYDVLTNEFIYDNGLEATVGTYDTDPELSGWTKDYQKAFDLMVKYNQKSMWDVEAGGEILNPKYDKKKNPMREDVNE